MIDLPKEIILHIASFIEREYLNEDDLDDLEDEGISQIELKNLNNYLKKMEAMDVIIL
jgi:hypothetical protein